MKALVDKLRADKEIVALRKRHCELYGYGMPYHWDCFDSIEHYKQCLKEKVDAAEKKEN